MMCRLSAFSSILLLCWNVQSSTSLFLPSRTRSNPFDAYSVFNNDPTRNAHQSILKRRHCKSTSSPRSALSSSLQMRDASSATWFNAGDRVRVVDDVMKAGTNLRGQVGIVTETWEKCDVDPTCCCAEQVDLGMAVHVQFPTENSLFGGDFFIHYFAEEELERVKEEDESIHTNDIGKTSSQTVAFDGLSCKEFKLDQLKMGAQAQRIAAFEKSRSDGVDGSS